MDNKILFIRTRLKNLQQYLDNLLQEDSLGSSQKSLPQVNNALQKIDLGFTTFDDIHLDITHSDIG